MFDCAQPLIRIRRKLGRIFASGLKLRKRDVVRRPWIFERRSGDGDKFRGSAVRQQNGQRNHNSGCTEVVTGLGSRARASLLCRGAAAVAHSLFPYVAPETFVAVTIDTSLRRLPRAGQWNGTKGQISDIPRTRPRNHSVEKMLETRSIWWSAWIRQRIRRSFFF